MYGAVECMGHGDVGNSNQLETRAVVIGREGVADGGGERCGAEGAAHEKTAGEEAGGGVQGDEAVEAGEEDARGHFG